MRSLRRKDCTKERHNTSIGQRRDIHKMQAQESNSRKKFKRHILQRNKQNSAMKQHETCFGSWVQLSYVLLCSVQLRQLSYVKLDWVELG